MKYIDLHCDTLMQAFLGQKKEIGNLEKAMVDLERLKQGDCMAQFFAIFMPPLAYRAKLGNMLPDDETYIKILHSILMNTIAQYPDKIALACNAVDLEKNKQAGKISAFLTIEDGRPIEGSIANLERYYEMGIRLISLTWNEANCFGAPNSNDVSVMAQGLTGFGKDAVVRMNELGMMVDVSHLSDGGFWDVAKICKKPFVASHSNCRSLSPHRRNLTDEMIRAVANSGGIIGLNFGPEFLNSDITCKDSTAQRIAEHARHMANVGGVECVAIGSDFDGITGNFDVDSPDKMPLLFDTLTNAGFSGEEIERIAVKNAIRAIRDILG